MPIYLGNNKLSKINLGSGNIKEAYLGSTKVFGEVEVAEIRLKADTSFTVTNNLSAAIEYSLTATGEKIELAVNGSVSGTDIWLWECGSKSTSSLNKLTITGSNVRVSGQLVDGKTYQYLFYGCTAITDASGLRGATILITSCYSNMFYGCTSLTSTPELPATGLNTYCYRQMFQGCTSLTSTPELPATTLASSCYHGMFQGCTSLTSTPELQATTLATSCYNSMFRSCTALTTPPQLPATTLAVQCYISMFYGCTGITWTTDISATPYRLPTTGTGTKVTNWNSGMFARNSGTLPEGTGNPLINTTYYYTVATDNTQKGERDV